ncbi:terminase large subunit [bacterium]|nr:terminase large subunit [bacterium]
MPLKLNLPQNDFYHMDKPFRAFVAGYRGGKTFLGCVRLCTLALEYPGIRLGYFAPTYPQIRDIFYTTIADVAELLDMTVDIKTSNNEVSLYFHGELHAMVKCRSMEHPARIVGFDINHALIDEIDCMKKEKADAAWKKIVARLSSSGFDEARLYDEDLNHDLIIEALETNTVDFTTTPEGFNWIYQFFVKQLRDDPELQEFYGIINASSRQNAKNLPSDYIKKLEATYPANLVDAYVDGEFVNLSSGSVYRQFDRRENHTDIEDDGKSTLHIGMDFNVGKMSAVVHIERDGLPVAVNEIFGCLDTPDMIQHIQMKYPSRKICIYPDSSGKNRKSNEASTTDISCLEDAGFNLYYDSTNPRVRDRINAVNAMLCNGSDERKYKVNTNTCPRYTDDLEQQVYNKQGEPDKAHDNDHMPDAGGYYIAYAFPIVKPIIKQDFRWQR